MSIPPIASSNNLPFDSTNPLVKEFDQLWNIWAKEKTEATGQKLLEFLEQHGDELKKIAEQNPHPEHAFVPFDHALDAAKRALTMWMEKGSDPDWIMGAEEFVADVAKWIEYAR